MYSSDKFKNKTSRARPSQDRSKERVRIILAAALTLYQEKGIEAVTTNDIAKRARVPIGSLYRYYPNKNAITAALTELYVEDMIKLFDAICEHPMLELLSWEEVLLLLTDGWANYERMNGPFEFLYIERTSPVLRNQTQHLWDQFNASFVAVLVKRCPLLDKSQQLTCFRLCLAAADMGADRTITEAVGQDAYYELVSAAACYMMRICPSTEHHTGGILSDGVV